MKCYGSEQENILLPLSLFMVSSCLFLYLKLLRSSFNLSLKGSSYPEGIDKFKAGHFFSLKKKNKQNKTKTPQTNNTLHLNPTRKQDPGHPMALSVLISLAWNQSNTTGLHFPPPTTNGMKRKVPDLQTWDPGTYSIGTP